MQSAANYDCGAAWSTLADRYGFALLMPEQSGRNNLNRSFNRFQRNDTQRGAGEAHSIVQMGVEANFLEGGLAGWTEKGMPTRRNIGATPSKWVTREHPEIDCVASLWLIRRFIDPSAEFIYVPKAQVLTIAQQPGGTPSDIDAVEFTHEGERCSFDTILRIHDIKNPALDHLATTARGADTSWHDLVRNAAACLRFRWICRRISRMTTKC
jgi:hypothetical protein